MPLSQVEITASHLPTSCSFFLSALQPLGYRCLGYRGKAIAFGIDQVEFYVGPRDDSLAHSAIKIALTAPSVKKVEDVYSAALNAGGRCQRSPSEIWDESSYYSASVLDFDNNQIEVIYRRDATRVTGDHSQGSDMQSIRKWQKAVAYDSGDNVHEPSKAASSRIIVNNISNTPAVKVYRVRQESKPEGEISTRAIIGTLLGASAGAVVAYAMVKSESGKIADAEPYRVEYAKEAPAHGKTEVIYRPSASTHSCSRGIEMIDLEADNLLSRHSNPKSCVKTISAPPLSGHAGYAGAGTRSHTGRTIAQTSGTKILTGEAIPRSHASSRSRRKSQYEAGVTQSPQGAQSSAIRSARDVPLPPSAISTNLTPFTSIESPLNDVATVVPNDSVSQVSTKRSSKMHERSDHHHHHHHSKLGPGSKHSKRSSHESNRTIKASDRYASNTGSTSR